MKRPKEFSAAERAAVFRVIEERRDIRSYRPEPVPPRLLWKLLEAAHHAASVGFMQPWNFIVVEERALRQGLYEHFRSVNGRAARNYAGERRATYQSLKLQGLLDAPLTLVVTCDPDRGGAHVLGRATVRETDLYSTCLAIQNFWLAARAEGVGVGWMSLMEPDEVARLLGIPRPVIPVAVLTVGYAVEFPDEPMLETVGWRARLPLGEAVYRNRWGEPYAPPDPASAPVDPPPPQPPRSTLAEAAARQANLTKPPGSLGRLEDVVLKVCGIQGVVYPRLKDRVLLLLAGDHGVTAEGVSAYGREVTAKMVYQFIAGAGAVNVFARRTGLRLLVADVGVDHDFSAATGVIAAKVARGTANLCREAAMTEAQARQAVAAGYGIVSGLEGLDLLALGEMGIGNTTAATALACALLAREPEALAGPGTGLGPEGLARKVRVVRQALALHTEARADPWQALRRMGGFEIAALVGAMQAAAERRVPIVLDGFITGAAALAAVRLTPAVRDHLIAGHRSAEPGHGIMLEALGLAPLLDLGMRLGEGSGAALAVGLIEAACATMTEMRTFEEAGIEHTQSTDAKA